MCISTQLKLWHWKWMHVKQFQKRMNREMLLHWKSQSININRIFMRKFTFFLFFYIYILKLIDFLIIEWPIYILNIGDRFGILKLHGKKMENVHFFIIQFNTSIHWSEDSSCSIDMSKWITTWTLHGSTWGQYLCISLSFI